MYICAALKAVNEGLKKCEDCLNWHYKYSGKYGISGSEIPNVILESGEPARPNFFKAACLLATLLTTCASADRVFSILNSRFGKGGSGGRALADYVSASLMLAFNNRNL